MIIKKIFCSFSMILTLLGCGQASDSGSSKELTAQKQSGIDTSAEIGKPASLEANDLLTLADAEKILGEPAHWTDSSYRNKIDTLEYKSTFTANAKDQKTGKTGAIYYMIELYTLNSAAKEAYASIKSANQNHEGVKVLNDLGDEAYFHTDNQNFYFVLVRKGVKMFRIKVNKITSRTSLNEFNRVMKKIADAL